MKNSATLAVTLALASGLVLSVCAEEADPVVVPSPSTTTLAELELPPNWAMLSQSDDTEFDYEIDLDLLAPLGNGTANSADFFIAFADGQPRAHEFRDADRIEVEDYGRLFVDGDELSQDAAPWCDNATMRFYPDHFAVKGPESKVADYLFILTLARTWAWRGVSAEDPEAGLEELRRVIRLGRLTRQEKVTLIGELVGIAAIKIGAQGIFQIAQREDRPLLALIAARVIHDSDGVRLSLMGGLEKIDKVWSEGETSFGGLLHSFNFDDVDVSRVITAAKANPNRVLRNEAILALAIVRQEGNRSQRSLAQEAIDALTGDADPIIAANAEWAKTAEIDMETAMSLQ